MAKRLKGWLEISTDGFAQRQEDRPPTHLLKELIQNALDAVSNHPSTPEIRVTFTPFGSKVGILVEDNGPGVEDLSALRTVFCTGKEDSIFLRGRMGQGFKEILCLAEWAEVSSRTWAATFHVEKGQRLCDVATIPPVAGTRVMMRMPWPKKVIPTLVDYLKTFLIPEAISFVVLVDGTEAYRATPRDPAHVIKDVSLRTETFSGARWVRKKELGAIHLVPLIDGIDDGEAMVYEMGIPVCSAEWPQPYHIDVQMRVPMNPRRDAVASGYLKEVYSACLPVLMTALEPKDLRDEWVSQAVTEVPEELQKQVVTAAFGATAVRSVPTMGTRHDFDADAKELGFEPVKTQYLPAGLRSVAEQYLSTSRDVEMERRSSVLAALEATPSAERGNDGRVKQFCGWLAQQVLGITIDVRIVPDLTTPHGAAFMSWSAGGRLALNANYRSQWANIMRPENLGILIHEMAHEAAGHHGDEFRKEVERLAGRVALIFLRKAEEINTQFADLLPK